MGPARGRCHTGRMRIYTKTGDDGTTGRLYGGRVAKTDLIVDAAGDVDELIAVLGLARATPVAEGAFDDSDVIFNLQRKLFILGADISANPERRHKLSPGTSLLTQDDVVSLESAIDDVVDRQRLRPVFIVPGTTVRSAHLDHARAIARRAERSCLRARDAG